MSTTTTRKKKPALAILTMDDANALLAKYATADANRIRKQAELDAKLTKIREQYADELNELTEECETTFDALQSFYQGKKAELFKQKKSIDTTHGTIGFRIATPGLKLFKGITWKAVLQVLKSKKLLAYVRTKEEPNKEALIADREQPAISKLFTKDELGCFVDQEETFYIELKKEETANA